MARYQYVALAALLILSVLDVSRGHPQLPGFSGGLAGGYSPIDDLNRDDVKEATAVTQTYIEEELISSSLAGDSLPCEFGPQTVVTKAESQVVAGTNYRLTVETTCGVTRTCEVVIFKDLPFRCPEGLPNSCMKVTNFDCQE